MPARKPTLRQQLRTALARATAEGNDALVAELSLVRHAVQGKSSPRSLVPLLETARHRPLMRAAAHPANARHTARLLLACARYDCSAHLAFFVRFLLTRAAADEGMLCAMEVIEAMKGPFAPAAVKRAQGARLGTPANLTPAATQKGRDQNRANAHANEHNERAAAHILLLKEKGFNYSQIAEKLNALRFVTRTGKAFRAEQVKRLYQRVTAPALAPTVLVGQLPFAFAAAEEVQPADSPL